MFTIIKVSQPQEELTEAMKRIWSIEEILVVKELTRKQKQQQKKQLLLRPLIIDIALRQRKKNTIKSKEADKSISELKVWLNDFEQQNRIHNEKVNHVGRAPEDIPLAKPKRAAIPVKASFITTKQPMKRIHGERGGPTMTPVRFKNRQNYENVKATDTGYASVKQLSKWLANDPTVNKSERGIVRRGINVIMKARAFDKDLADIIVEEADIEKDKFDDKCHQLEQAFESNDVEDKCQWLKKVFKPIDTKYKSQWLQQADDARGIEDRGAPGEKEIQDKSEWLKQAFEGKETYLTREVGDRREWLETAFEPTEINTSLDFDNVSVLTEAISVDGKKKCLSGAFEGERGTDEIDAYERQSAVTELVSVQDKKKWLSSAFGVTEKAMNRLYDVSESKSCTIVSDKKEWLQTAFQKGSQGMVDAMKSESNDAATPAKKKWRERRRSSRNSGRRSPEKRSGEHKNYEPTNSNECRGDKRFLETNIHEQLYERKISDISGSDRGRSFNFSSQTYDRSNNNEIVRHIKSGSSTTQRGTHDSLTVCKPPTPVNASSKQPGFDDEPRSVIESDTSLDFKSARLLLANKKW